MIDLIKKNGDHLDFDTAIVITCFFWLLMILCINELGHWLRN